MLKLNTTRPHNLRFYVLCNNVYQANTCKQDFREKKGQKNNSNKKKWILIRKIKWCKLKKQIYTYICIKLAYKTGEIIVLKVFGE